MPARQANQTPEFDIQLTQTQKGCYPLNYTPWNSKIGTAYGFPVALLSQIEYSLHVMCVHVQVSMCLQKYTSSANRHTYIYQYKHHLYLKCVCTCMRVYLPKYSSSANRHEYIYLYKHPLRFSSFTIFSQNNSLQNHQRANFNASSFSSEIPRIIQHMKTGQNTDAKKCYAEYHKNSSRTIVAAYIQQGCFFLLALKISINWSASKIFT